MTRTSKTTAKKIARINSTSVLKMKMETQKPTRLDQLEALLMRPDGATIAEMSEATGWQAHSIRSAMAVALKKRGLTIASEKIDGVRRYRANERSAAS